MYRKFYLENSLGDKCYLADKQFKQFLGDVQGLGYSVVATTITVGNKEIVADEQTQPSDVSGVIYFFNEVGKAYQDYDDFISFIRHAPLKLYYLPPNKLFPYYAEGLIVQIDKGEYSTSGYLPSNFVFHRTTFWQNSQESVYEISNVESKDGKYYDLERPYHYSGNSLNQIIINNQGDMPVGFEFEIIGNVTNPRLTAIQNGVTYGLLKLDGTFDYVKVDSDDERQYIYLEQDGSIVANPGSYQDLSIKDGVANVTFFKLAVGESKLAFSCDKLSTFDGKLRFKWKDLRKSI